MNITSKLACVAATVAAAGLMSAPAQGATAHCPGHQDGNKVETSGAPSVATDLPDGTTVCYKAGNQIGETTVMNGMITSTILNKNGNGVLGVSYYVPGEPPECNPSLEDCDEEPPGNS